MPRRQYIRKLSAGATALGFRPAFGDAAAQPQVAITMDDFDLFGEIPAEKETNSRVVKKDSVIDCSSSNKGGNQC
jgi:hypothetical protein